MCLELARVWVCVCVGLCVCVSHPGVHCSGHGLPLPVGEGGSCEVRSHGRVDLLFSDWPGWLLLGNSQPLRCHGAWKRRMSHSSLPTGLRETSSLSPGPGFTRSHQSHKEALPKPLPFLGRPADTEPAAASRVLRRCDQVPLKRGALRLPPQDLPQPPLPKLSTSLREFLPPRILTPLVEAPPGTESPSTLCLVSSLSSLSPLKGHGRVWVKSGTAAG